MPPRVLIAGLFHETHTFLDEITGLNQFQILRGRELLDCAGDGSPLGGAIETAQRFGWDIVPTTDCRAQPSGTVADEVFESYWSELQGSIERAGRLDAIYLVLHGAMVTPSVHDVEGEFLERLRKLPGIKELPIFGVFDLHANFSSRMAEHADCLVAYRQNPHADACAMGIRAVELLNDTLQSGTRARTFWRHTNIVWPPTGTGTSDTPMRELEELARRMEQQHNLPAVNVVGGFAFADTPDTGVSFSICGRIDDTKADELLDELCDCAWQHHATGNKVDPPLDEVMAQLRAGQGGLTVVVEPSDNIGGGAPGDCTGLLRAFVQHRLENAAICVNDPQAVAQLQSFAPGRRITLPLGGKGSRLDEGPFALEVELVSLNDGRFTLEDRNSHLASMYGERFDMGRCAVVRHGGVTILLTSIKTPPFDLGQWRSQGIAPEKLSLIGVKAAVAHRRVYDPIAARMLWVDTPGPCRSDLRTFPYRNIRRPIWPLDA